MENRLSRRIYRVAENAGEDYRVCNFERFREQLTSNLVLKTLPSRQLRRRLEDLPLNSELRKKTATENGRKMAGASSLEMNQQTCFWSDHVRNVFHR